MHEKFDNFFNYTQLRSIGVLSESILIRTNIHPHTFEKGSVADPDPRGSASLWEAGSGSASK
jgi:hypothetical protein